MIRSILIFILAASAMWGQTQPSTPPPSTAQPAPTPSAASPAPAPQPSTPPGPQDTPKLPTPPAQPESASKVAPTAAVITIKGICNNAPARRTAGTAARKAAPAAASTGPCQTVITREEFEKLLQSINAPPTARRNIAQAYVELMAFAQAAEKAGVENDPKFKEQIRLMRLQALASIYRRDLEDKNKNPSSQEIQAYYNQNLPKYEEIKLDRIFIPAKNPSAPAKDDWEKKAEQVANDMHDRAAKGEDFEKLQKEAYTTLGLTIAPPNTSVGTRRRGMLTPAEEQELFALKAGDVSKVEPEPAGYIIYKVESKQTLPEEQVKDEISRELFRQKMESQMKSITSSVKADLNDEYFGAPTPPPVGMGPGGPMSRPPVPAPAHAPAPATPQTQAPPK